MQDINFQIKAAAEEDVPQIVALIREFAEFEKLSEFCEVTQERLNNALFGEKPCVESLVAFDADENLIAYALFYENFSSFRGQRGIYLEDLYVAPAWRKIGVGLALIKKLALIGKSRGAERMDWLVLDWNEAAIRFYKRLGAEIDETERHFKLVGKDFERLAAAD